jgi:hypothetical protein
MGAEASGALDKIMETRFRERVLPDELLGRRFSMLELDIYRELANMYLLNRDTGFPHGHDGRSRQCRSTAITREPFFHEAELQPGNPRRNHVAWEIT